MIRLERLVLREVALSLREPFRTSSGAIRERRILLVEATGADGEAGWGECVAQETPSYTPETVGTAWLAIPEWVAPAVLGLEFAGPGDLFPALDRAFRGHPMAKAAVEMAAWDLAARQQGVSLSRLLGGTRDRVETGISPRHPGFAGAPGGAGAGGGGGGLPPGEGEGGARRGRALRRGGAGRRWGTGSRCRWTPTPPTPSTTWRCCSVSTPCARR